MVSEEGKETQIRKAVKTQSKKRGARIKIRGTSEEEDDSSISVVGSTRRKKRKASQNVKRGREIKEDKSEEDVLIVEDQEEMGKGKQVMASETAFKLPNKTIKTEIEYQGLTIHELKQHTMLVLEDLETVLILYSNHFHCVIISLYKISFSFHISNHSISCPYHIRVYLCIVYRPSCDKHRFSERRLCL